MLAVITVILALATLSCAPNKAALTPGSQTTSPPAATAAKVIPLAQNFVKQLAQKDYKGAETNFDATMQNALPADKLQAVWEQVQSTNGTFQGQAGVRTAVENSYNEAIVTGQFANGKIDIKIVFDKDERIGGLWFAPAA
jgi:hypothetical protein